MTDLSYFKEVVIFWTIIKYDHELFKNCQTWSLGMVIRPCIQSAANCHIDSNIELLH